MHHHLKKNLFKPNQQRKASPNRATWHLRLQQISFNSLNKFVISLSAVIGALGSLLGPHPESDLETNLYSGRIYPDSYQDESDRRISFNNLIKSTISLSATIDALGSLLWSHPKSDLAIDLYSVSTPNPW
jgi:hypothetical protein